ncbi:MAG: chromosomal replication initiator protein DnaA, partial [Elusimicrobiota bacterium]
MVLKSYLLEHAPSHKDKNRYKLSLSGSEKDVESVARKLSNKRSRPFPSPDKNYDWSLFLYNIEDDFKNKLKHQLDKIIQSQSEHEKKEEKKAESSKKGNQYISLNKNYNFSNFVVGTNTRFTYAACKAVAENPGKNYNPLFIYGGVGLGKTHLMHAIGNYVKDKYPDNVIVYITTDDFINEVVEAIEMGAIKKVRSKYRKVDLLLMDDIQFLEQSESTQEEFFHIFNAMHEVSKQIVMSSDKPPKKLSTLEDRLKSRFEWGLTADIKVPNFETRKAILNKKAVEAGIKISEEISNYIAERLTSNIRELEGIINRITAFQELSQEKITLNLIKDIINNILPSEKADREEKDEKELKKKMKQEPQKKSPSGQQQFFPPPPPPPPQYAQPAQMSNICSRCGGNMVFVPQYQRWYCSSCGTYSEPASHFQQQYTGPQPPPPQTEEKCPECNYPLRYIEKYDRHYCDNCKQYIEEEGEKEPGPTMPSPKEIKEEQTPQAEEKEEKRKKIIDFENKTIGTEKKDIREIKAGYFLPEGSEKIFSNVIEKLNKLANQKKFNFYIKPLFTHYISFDTEINYDKIAHISKTNNIDIALFVEPGENAEVNTKTFLKQLTNSMDKIDMPFETLSREEIKESDALNLMLDIA